MNAAYIDNQNGGGMAEAVETITALGVSINVVSRGEDDYISLTDIARYKSDAPDDVIKNWLRNRNTIEYLGVWETLNNPDFKPVEFDGFRQQAGMNSFTMSPTKWVRTTGAIGIRVKRGKNGGTFAHKDIAFEFASWISPEFKLYVIKDYQRLKADENNRLSLEWSEKRLFAKMNYRIHTDAIKAHLVPRDISKVKEGFIYANEADVLNVALFGTTAKQWRDAHPGEDGNIRDHATLHQLIVLANLESMNAQLVIEGMSRKERAAYLNQVARWQMSSLENDPTLRRLESGGRLLADGTVGE